MKRLNKIFKKNPLRFTFILSGFLHLVGFYCLSSLSYTPPVKKAEVVSIKIKTLIKNENISQGNTKSKKTLSKETAIKNSYLTASKLKTQSEPGINLQKYSTTPARPTQLTANALEFFSPSTLYRESSQTASKYLPMGLKNTPVTNVIGLIKNTTSASLHTQTINLKGPSSIILRNKAPVYIEKFKINYTDNSTALGHSLISNELGNKSKSFHSRSIAKSNISISLTHSPSHLVPQKLSKPHFDPRLKVRMASLESVFSEEYFDANKVHSNLNSDSTKDEQGSTLELGKLRKGFANQVRSNIIKAKYYPRIARKLGFEGKPMVAFALGHKGELINLLLAQPSDYKILNDAALETIRRGAPYPPIPDQLKEKLINFKLPISYILEEY